MVLPVTALPGTLAERVQREHAEAPEMPHLHAGDLANAKNAPRAEDSLNAKEVPAWAEGLASVKNASAAHRISATLPLCAGYD